MKIKHVLAILGLTIALVGCGATESSSYDEEFYTQSVSQVGEYGEALKIVDEETGCKFLVVYGDYEESVSVTQMRYIDENGQEKLLCEKK